MRRLFVIYEHRRGTCDSALSFVLRAVSTNTGLSPDLQDANGGVNGFRILETINDGLLRFPFYLLATGGA